MLYILHMLHILHYGNKLIIVEKNVFYSDASAENKQSLKKVVRVIVFSTSLKFVEASHIYSILHKRNQM